MSNEEMNYKLAVDNAKDIQRLSDAMILQSEINKSHRRAGMFTSLGCMIMTGVMYFIVEAVADLQKRVKTIEGVEKKIDNTED